MQKHRLPRLTRSPLTLLALSALLTGLLVGCDGDSPTEPRAVALAEVVPIGGLQVQVTDMSAGGDTVILRLFNSDRVPVDIASIRVGEGAVLNAAEPGVHSVVVQVYRGEEIEPVATATYPNIGVD